MIRKEKKILIVDDDQTVRETLEKIIQKHLQSTNLSFQLASSGNGAISLLEQDAHFDLIITDFIMPNGTGADLIIYLSQNSNKSPVILFTNMQEPYLPNRSQNFLGIIYKDDLCGLIKLIEDHLRDERIL